VSTEKQRKNKKSRMKKKGLSTVIALCVGNVIRKFGKKGRS